MLWKVLDIGKKLEAQRFSYCSEKLVAASVTQQLALLSTYVLEERAAIAKENE